MQHGEDLSWTSIKEKADEFINKGSKDEIIKEDDIEQDFMVPVGRFLIILANAVVVIVIGVMAIKWITANPDQKAKLKQQLIGLVVAIIVIYGAVGIWQVLKNFMTDLI